MSRICSKSAVNEAGFALRLERLFKYINTIRYLKPRQIGNRIFRRFRKVDVSVIPELETRHCLGRFVPFRFRASSMCGGDFVFLNERHEFSGWNDNRRSELWLYNLHYFDDLSSIDAQERFGLHAALIDKWIRENPPGVGAGWEPYPTSLRIVNWVKWMLANDQASEGQLKSLSLQISVLAQTLETHLLGNHLFANAKALIFAGLFFHGEESDIWLEKGLKILQAEIPEQILGDGGNFELSPMYHGIITADMLDLLGVIRAFEDRRCDALATCIEGRLPKMLAWSKVMSHPDGGCSFFNDAANKIAPTVTQLEIAAKALGVEAASCPSNSEKVNYLSESGYFRLNLDNAVVLGDVGRIGPDYLPGHAHADTLSFELSVFAQRLVVNSGTSVYGLGVERLRQRGTGAHSTVLINGEDSSEVWSGFRVARRARPIGAVVDVRSQTIRCAHDGYLRLSGKPVHTREWKYSSSALVVRDTVTGSFETAEARYHIHPKWNCVLEANRLICKQKDWMAVITIQRGPCRLESTSYHPEFGLSSPNSVLVVQLLHDNPTSEIHIRW